MIVEVVRYVAAVLNSSSYGLNVKLSSIGLDSTVAGVEDTRPADVNAILNEFDHDIAARRHVPEDAAQAAPYVMVFQAREADIEGWVTQTTMDARSIPVAVMIAQRDADTATGNLACGYYLRCAQQSLASGFADATARTRNSVQVTLQRDMVPVAPFVQVGSAVMSRGLLIEYQARETDAT